MDRLDRKLTTKEYVFLASMLFGMFFGAGNVIFPVHMGQLAGGNLWPAAIGFCITGAGLPLLGVAAMGVSKSEGLFDMSSKVGKAFGYFFTCALYLTIGPLFAIPRTATVSYQVGVASFVPEDKQSLILFLFSLLFFCAVLFFALRPSNILTWIGKILNPIFLIFLGILLVAIIVKPMGPVTGLAPTGDYATKSFATGLLEGYNTMDGLAALAFGIILIEQIRRMGVKSPTGLTSTTIKAGVLSVVLMAVIYGLLTYAGAQSINVMAPTEEGGSAFNAIARHYFGTFGSVLMGMMITFACLKTAIGLVQSCGETFSEMFPGTLKYKPYAIGFTVFSFALANMGLERIITFAVPVLVLLYPMSFVLVILCLAGRTFGYEKKVFATAMAFTAVSAVCDMIRALPADVQEILPGWNTVNELYAMIPLSSFGMGWMIPAAVGTAAGLVWLALAGGRSVKQA
ncbi:MAG: branched-chain amino acid transport system II carrier protein [Hornefia sp.]|nr:branched-chain amino acid transport system II carrier protein [Hornefia sp.]